MQKAGDLFHGVEEGSTLHPSRMAAGDILQPLRMVEEDIPYLTLIMVADILHLMRTMSDITLITIILEADTTPIIIMDGEAIVPGGRGLQ